MNTAPLRMSKKLCLLALLGLAACGTNHGSLEAPRAVPPGALTASVDGFKLTAGTGSLAYDGSLRSLRLETEDGPDEVVVRVSVDGARRLKALYFDLDYDPRQYTPTAAQASAALGSEGLLELAVLRDAGTVHHGQVLVKPQDQAGFSGDAVLAEVRFARVPNTETRIASAAPLLKGSKTRVDYNLKANVLVWKYANQGDYDQNGEVNIADLTPLAVRFGDKSGGTPAFPDSSIEYIVDGDGNGEIGISDLSPIGANFLSRVTKYNVYQGAESDIPLKSTDPSTVPALGSLDFTAHSGNPAHEPLQFVFSPPAPVTTAVYWVRPADGNSEGIPSSADGDVIELAADAVSLGSGSGIQFVGKVDDDTYQFLDPPGGHDIGVGDVLFGVYEEVATGDFRSILVRVTAIVSRAGDLVTVDIFRASITDVIKNGAINAVTDMNGGNTTTTDNSIRKPCAIGGGGPVLHSQTIRYASDAPQADTMILPPDEFQQRFRLVTADYVREQAAKGPSKTASHLGVDLPLEGLTVPLPPWVGPDFGIVVDSGSFVWEDPVIENYIDVSTQHVDAVITPGTPALIIGGVVIIPEIPPTEISPAFDFPTGLGDFGATASGAVRFDVEAHATGTVGPPPPGAPPIEYQFATISHKFVFLVGGFPVEMTTSLNAYVGIEIEPGVNFYARSGMHMDYSMLMGVDYTAAGALGTEGHFEPVFEDDFNCTPTRTELRVDGHANLFVYLRGEVKVALYEDVPGANAGVSLSLSPGVDVTFDGTADTGGEYCVNYDVFGRLKCGVEIFWEPLGSNINFLKAIFGSSFNPLPGVSAEFPLFDLDTPIFTGGVIGCDGGRPPTVYLGRVPGSTGTGPLPVTVFYDALGVKDDHTDLPGQNYSIDPDGGKLAHFFWDLDGDGHCEQDTDDNPVATHTYDAYGDYDVTVWVVDDDGMLTKKSIVQTIAP